MHGFYPLKCTLVDANSDRKLLQECLCVLVVDDSEEVSAPAQEFIGYLFSSSAKHHVQHDIAEIFSRFALGVNYTEC